MRAEQVADGVFRITATHVNAWLLREGDELTLVDAGYPKDVGAVLAAIAAQRLTPEAVRAVLLTHAHVDHMGAADHLHTAYGTPVLCSPAEVGHARRERLEQLGPATLTRNLWRRGMIPWTVAIVRSGAARDVRLPYARSLPPGLDLPGRPVLVPTPGHTSGHAAFLLPHAGAVLSGDGLVTGHALSPTTGPQLPPAMFDHSRAGALRALDVLTGLDADLLLPGHGEPWRGPLPEAVAQARRSA